MGELEARVWPSTGPRASLRHGWRQNPITIEGHALVADGVLNEGDLVAIGEEIAAEIADAVTQAAASSTPPVSAMFTNIRGS